MGFLWWAHWKTTNVGSGDGPGRYVPATHGWGPHWVHISALVWCSPALAWHLGREPVNQSAKCLWCMGYCANCHEDYWAVLSAPYAGPSIWRWWGMGLQKKQEGQYELRLVHLKHLDPELFGISDFSDILKFLHILNRVSWHWNASLGIKCVHKTC